ncbi:methyltransferase domain-containing protein [Kaustia mangrovi]|uniref:Methyltransferase domain-containing protein n=1 Tax=Kaustia mangrovi TaxID=2593653 RepID=A0A7S8C6N2_9HYPH|nr:methyltransferase domain-containing protein [Kaustia mangrovi]QPC44390.1 methyltransferase domain-containing protein [Kaustia mangrovi]
MTSDVQSIVRETKEYYDGAADHIYRDIWGENIHLGIFETPGQDLPSAMVRSNERVADRLSLGARDRVLDVGCGYGAFARFLAERFGCQVLATNISDRELAWGRKLTEDAGLDDRVSFEWADFHDLQFDDASFDCYSSQEAFLHACDKTQVLKEAFRVLKPGGTLVFTDLLVREGTPEADRERIYERVKSPDMWDTKDYKAALKKAGFALADHADWSTNVAPTYGWVRDQLETRRGEFERRIGKSTVDRTSNALKFWVDGGNQGKIGWEFFLAVKPQ